MKSLIIYIIGINAKFGYFTLNSNLCPTKPWLRRVKFQIFALRPARRIFGSGASNSKKGFTMVELLVVLVLFVLIIDAAINIFISMIGYQRRLLAEQQFLNQASYAMEYMSKALRSAVPDIQGSCLYEEGGVTYAGYSYLLTHLQDNNAYAGVRFIDDGGVCREFFMDDDDRLKEIKNSSQAVPILDSQLSETKFIINGDKGFIGVPSGAEQQTRITILLNIVLTQAGQSQKLVQTTVVQRNLSMQ